MGRQVSLVEYNGYGTRRPKTAGVVVLGLCLAGDALGENCDLAYVQCVCVGGVRVCTYFGVGSTR